jgi:hypothetical protein
MFENLHYNKKGASFACMSIRLSETAISIGGERFLYNAAFASEGQGGFWFLYLPGKPSKHAKPDGLP